MRFIILFLCLISCLRGKQLEVDVGARSAILMNASSGAILYEKNAHMPAYPASTTKIATSLYVLDKEIDLERLATVSSESLRSRPLKDRDHLPAYWLDSDGTTMGLKRGEVITFEALLHGLMLVSGNDAANVIAESVGGSVPAFMDMLNEYLQEIGCQKTKFTNPHGLTHPEHFSTAYDLALMTKRALHVPKFRKLVSTLSYTKPKTNKQTPVELKLTNPLLNPKSSYYYPKAIGVKTGYTSAAQDTLVAAAEHNGRTLIAVVLGCEKKGGRFEDVKRLFETAFTQNKARRRLLGPENSFVKEITAANAQVKASVPKPLILEYFPAEEPKCKAALHWTVGKLPIRKGEKVGEVHILDDKGLFLQKEDLFAVEDVKGSFFYMLKESVSQLFR